MLVRPNHDPGSLMRNQFDVSSNEAFISTQMALLDSRPVMHMTLHLQFPDMEVTESALKRFKKAISIKRIPLNNLMKIRLKWNSAETVAPLLNTYLIAYKKWYADNVRDDAVKLDEYYSKELDYRKSELALAERSLRMIYDEMNANNSDFQGKMSLLNQDMASLEEDIRRAEKRLADAEIQKSKLAQEIFNKTGIDLSVQTRTGPLTALDNDLISAHKKYWEINMAIPLDSAGLRGEKIRIQYLQDEISESILRFLSGVDGIMADEVDMLLGEYIALHQELLSAEADISRMKDSVSNKQVERERLNSLSNERERMEKMVGVKESAYMDLLNKIENNRSFLEGDNSLGIKIISMPTQAEKTNGILKMCALALLSAIFTNSLIVYVLAGYGKHQRTLFRGQDKG